MTDELVSLLLKDDNLKAVSTFMDVLNNSNAFTIAKQKIYTDIVVKALCDKCGIQVFEGVAGTVFCKFYITKPAWEEKNISIAFEFQKADFKALTCGIRVKNPTIAAGGVPHDLCIYMKDHTNGIHTYALDDPWWVIKRDFKSGLYYNWNYDTFSKLKKDPTDFCNEVSACINEFTPIIEEGLAHNP